MDTTREGGTTVCQNCGAVMEAGAAYCNMCGTKAAEAPDANQYSADRPSQSPAEQGAYTQSPQNQPYYGQGAQNPSQPYYGQGAPNQPYYGQGTPNQPYYGQGAPNQPFYGQGMPNQAPYSYGYAGGNVQPEKRNSTVAVVAVICSLLVVAAVVLLIMFVIKPGSGSVGISVLPAELNMNVGEYQKIQTVIKPAGKTNEELLWASSNSSVATVDDGIVCAEGEGSCKISVALKSNGNAMAEVAVTVKGGSFVDNAAKTSASADQVYPNVYLSSAEVSNMDFNTLQFYINTIYAKNGYIFSTPSIAAYFKMQPWYTPETSNASDVSAKFNAVDKANLQLLIKYRALANQSGGYDTNTVGTLWTYDMVNSSLSESFVAGLSDYDIQLLIDTIYAKAGYIFETESIQSLFNTQYWYDGRTTDAKSLSFSQLDKANLALLGKYR